MGVRNDEGDEGQVRGVSNSAMSARAPVIIVPSETRSREFDAKLLLAAHLAARGAVVYVGARSALHAALHRLPPATYVAKDFRRASRRVFGILKDLGHSIVGWDEEGILNFNLLSYIERRVDAPTLARMDEIFAWGEENAAMTAASPGYHGQPLHVTGNPRIDMLRDELRPFHEPDVAALRQRFGDFILVNTNFGTLNHHLQQYVVDPRSQGNSGGIDMTPEVRASWEHRFRLYDAFRSLLPELGRALPGQTVVLRPHPSENLENWRQLLSGFANVHVLHEGAVAPWLMACRVLVHSNCTTAIEGFLLGTKVISFRPHVSEPHDHELANVVSRPVGSEAELVACLRNGALPVPAAPAEVQWQAVARNFASLTGPLASERIAALLLASHEQRMAGSATGPATRARGQAHSRLRALHRRWVAGRDGHKNSRAYEEKRFPTLGVAEVEERLERFRRLFPAMPPLAATGFGTNIFRIEQRPA